MRLIARSGLSTRTVLIAERFMLMEVTEYSRALIFFKKTKKLAKFLIFFKNCFSYPAMTMKKSRRFQLSLR